jgi:type IV pilus assembly protein PilQ
MCLPVLDAWAAKLNNFEYQTLPGEQVQLRFTLSEPVTGNPLSFTIDKPARVVLDFPNTQNGLKNTVPIPVGVGLVKDVVAIEAKGRTRVVLNLEKMTEYSTQVKGNQFLVNVAAAGGSLVSTATPLAPASIPNVAAMQPKPNDAMNLDFRRGNSGEGKIVIKLPNPHTNVNVTERGGKIILDFNGVKLPERLRQRLDVTDFATPVATIDARQIGNNAQLVVAARGEYEHLAYQINDTLI